LSETRGVTFAPRFCGITVSYRKTGLMRGKSKGKACIVLQWCAEREEKYMVGRVVKEFNPGLMIS
jgi:hypothetical protein